MNNSSNQDQLTVDELRAYQAGRLSGSDRHRVERLLLEYPFYADALAGLEALQQAGASLPAQTAQLRTALDQRIRESASQKRLWHLWLTALIVSILLFIGVAFYLIVVAEQQKPSTPPAQPKTTVPAQIN